MPNNWIDGLKRIPLHSLFAGVGIGARFLPRPFNFVVLSGFAAWRAWEEWQDYCHQLDTGAKAGIDFVSQVGAAVAGAFIS